MNYGPLNFGKLNYNADRSVWSVRRQLPTLYVTSSLKTDFFNNITEGQVVDSKNTSILVPLRSGSTLPVNGTYDNVTVVIFKTFNENFLNITPTENNWFEMRNYTNPTSGQTGINAVCKEKSDNVDGAGFHYFTVNGLCNTSGDIIQNGTPLVSNILAYFNTDLTFTTTGEDKEFTLTNPILTDYGRKLINWVPNLESNSDYTNKLMIGVYHNLQNKDITETEVSERLVGWDTPSGGTIDLLWKYPAKSSSNNQYVQLNLSYGKGTVSYYIDSTWTKCLVNYYDGQKFVPCIPHRFNGSEWELIQ